MSGLADRNIPEQENNKCKLRKVFFVVVYFKAVLKLTKHIFQNNIKLKPYWQFLTAFSVQSYKVQMAEI